MSCLPRWCRLSCLPMASLSSLEVFLRNSLFLSCLLRWKCSGDKARLNSGDPGLGDVWGVILAKCGDAGDPRRVSGEVLRGVWLWGWEGDTEVGEGVLARGDTGTWVDDFLLGERTARNFGISPWRVPGRRRKKHIKPILKLFSATSPYCGPTLLKSFLNTPSSPQMQPSKATSYIKYNQSGGKHQLNVKFTNKFITYVVVQFYTWFKLSFPCLGLTSLKQRKIKFKPTIKLNHSRKGT